MLRVVLAAVATLCALPASGARTWSGASESGGGLPECVWRLHSLGSGGPECVPCCAAVRCWSSGTSRRRAGPRCVTSSESRRPPATGSSTGALFSVERVACLPRAYARRLRSPQGDRSWPEVTNRKRLELLLSFWEARGTPSSAGASLRAELASRTQALESPASNFTRSPRRLIVEWHAEAHLLPPWERTVEARM